MVIIALTVLAVVYDFFVIRATPVDAYPDLSENQVLASADWMGRWPQEIQDQVNLDPALMQSYRVTFNQVFGAIAANNANLGAKVVEQNGQECIIRGKASSNRICL